ncbi:hypothetical protein AB0N16_10155 [Streptomyces sp. NPDC051105]|uniref:hypothetical protein n=1 Tax=Streptomyces sp. NPDC051105 TaxID=3154843 RepID=UPI00343F002A
MNPADHPTAWEHPPTRRAWGKQLMMSVLALLAWVALWFALLAVLTVILGPGYAIFVVPFLIYSFYRAFLQLFVVSAVFRMRRVLQVYLWQLSHEVRYGLTRRTDAVGRQFGWFEFPNPAQREEALPMVFGRHWGVG